MVKVYDARNNSSTKSVSGTTKLYTWNTYNVETIKTYSDETEELQKINQCKEQTEINIQMMEKKVEHGRYIKEQNR